MKKNVKVLKMTAKCHVYDVIILVLHARYFFLNMKLKITRELNWICVQNIFKILIETISQMERGGGGIELTTALELYV